MLSKIEPQNFQKESAITAVYSAMKITHLAKKNVKMENVTWKGYDANDTI